MIEARLDRPRVRDAVEALGVGDPVEWVARGWSTASVRPELAERNRETRHVRRLRHVSLLSPRIGRDVVVPSRDQRLIGVRSTSCDQEMAVDDPRCCACVRGGTRGKNGERVRDGVVLPRRRLDAVDRRRLEAAVQVDLAVRRVVVGGHLIPRGRHVRARAPRVRRDVVDQGRVVENDRIRSSRRTTEDVDLVRRRVVDRGGDKRRLRHVSQRRPRIRRRVVAVDRGQRRPDVLREVVAAEGVDVGAVGRRRRPEQGLRQRGNVDPRAGRWRRRRRRWRWRRPPPLKAASASTSPYPKWLFGTWSTPPHALPFATETLAFADPFSRFSVASMSRERAGIACQRSATTPTTCGPAIDVPLQSCPEYVVSLVFSDDRTFTPGAEISGLMRFEPSSVTGPRLLKPASETGVPVYVVAPVE